MACTTPCSCCKGACCTAGVCTKATCADCEIGGGTYKGAKTQCPDYDCTDGCCEGKTCIDDSGNTAYTKCEFGYNAGLCSGGSCTPGTPSPADSVPQCEEGADYPLSVTGSGFVGISGDPTFDALLDEVFNNTYSITRDCCNGKEWDGAACNEQVRFTPSNSLYEVRVSFPIIVAGRTASIALYLLPSTLVASAFRSDGGYSSSVGPCGNTLYACDDPISGAVTGSIGSLDSSGATISAS